MANIAASDVTVTLLEQRKSADRVLNNVKLAFGDGALTYAAGGVPITKAKLGCPNIIESLTIYDNGISIYAWSYDAVNEKLTAIENDGTPAQPTGVAIVAQVLKCEVMGW